MTAVRDAYSPTADIAKSAKAANVTVTANNQNHERKGKMSAEKKMTVKVTITVTITEEGIESWNLNYGTGTERSEVRKDIKNHIGNGVIDAISAIKIPGIEIDWK